jgi:hypothetical protein
VTAASLLVTASAATILALGVVHLVYTFFGPKLTPRDAALRARMSEVSPVLTRRTTMWRAWLGFNASHSLGAILFGLVYGHLALVEPRLLFDSPFLLGLGASMLLAYAAVGRAYWFSVPNTGIAIALIAFLAGCLAR